jgi:glycosyltransferase involved in cell wall biosynthesis
VSEDTVRVQHFIPKLTGGGAERQLRQLAPLLVERNIAVSIVARPDAESVDAMTRQGISFHPLKSKGNHDPRLLAEAIVAIRRFGPDMVQTWLPFMDVVGGAAARLTRVPQIVSERSSREAYAPTLKNRLRAFMGRRADAIIANSPAGLDVWQDHPSAFLVPNGIALSAIDQIPRGRLSQAPLMRDRAVVVTVARLAVEKRLDLLIRAVAKAKESVPEILLVLLGDGEEKERLLHLVIKLNLRDHVHFAGHQTNAWEWLRFADLFASVSAFEGHPNAVLEAAAARTPMLLSDIRAHRSSMGEGAIYVDPEDRDRTSDALVLLLRDQSVRASITKAARAVAERSSLTAAVDRYVAIYRSIAAQRNRR